MTDAARKLSDFTPEELQALVRAAVRAELGAEQPKPVDAPEPPAVRRKPPPEAYERMRRLRRKMGLDQ